MGDRFDGNVLIAELATCIAAVARGDVDHAREIIGGLARVFDVSAQGVLPGIPAPPAAMSADRARKSSVGRLFA